MDTLTLLNPALSPPRITRTAAALKALRSFYEHGEGLDEEEDEIELMIMLSGMVGGQARTLGED